MPIIRNCAHCGKEFATEPNRIAAGKGKHCSQACGWQAKRRPVVRICRTCGRTFEFMRSRPRVFCTMACRSQVARVEFWDRVDRRDSDACWEWIAGRDGDGYGALTVAGVQYKASRYAWILTNGDPGNLDVCHRCDNPPCCNPAHLFLGTDADNHADRERKGRGYWQQASRLTDDDVRALRVAYDRGDNREAIAARFGVALSTVQAIGSRRSRRFVSDEGRVDTPVGIHPVRGGDGSGHS